jgi:F-type H+-transporting ATPase subunit gamma
MANLRDLQKRRRSATSTRKITRTMELVASAKLKKAQDAAAASKPYAEGLSALVATISAVAGSDARHPLMTPRPVKKVLVLLAASDRGLCGAFNVNLAHVALARRAEHIKAGHEVAFVALGKKGGATLAFSGHAPAKVHTGLVGTTRYEKVVPVAEQVMASYLAGDFDQVEVVYSRFISAAKQLPSSLVLLPAGGEAKAPGAAKGAKALYEFLPSAEELLADLIPRTVRTALFSCLLQTSAAEHAARRQAMKNATDAAGDMIQLFSRAYNRGRQSKITQEIAEIVGAVEAMA